MKSGCQYISQGETLNSFYPICDVLLQNGFKMYAVLYGGQKIGRIGRIDRIGKALIGWQDLKNWKDLQD